jgi:hypothetical protein
MGAVWSYTQVMSQKWQVETVIDKPVMDLEMRLG